MVEAAPAVGAFGTTVSFTASAPTAEAGRASASNAAARSFMSGPDSRVAFVEPISFARGVPAPECLALEELADSARVAIERDGATALNYGPAGGYAPLREWIADRHRVEPERVVLTNGSLQGFRFLAELLSPTGTVIVEAPTYDRPLKILAELDAEVICVPLDEEPAVNGGAFLYTIPTFQNPTGRTLSKERRKGLADRARDGLLVLEDDPYGLVRFEGKPPPTVFELARGQNVVYSSSFSKTVAPGLRVGYLVLPNALAERVVAAATASYITPALLSQAIVYEFLRSGKFEPNLERICGLLRERRDAMIGALERHLPEATWTVPEGGYFVWLDLPDGIAASGLRAEGVTFVPGTDFFCGSGGESALRLAFSYESPSAIEEGVRRLASAVRAAIVLSRAA
jgi:2-aminoadipate transaminase